MCSACGHGVKCVFANNWPLIAIGLQLLLALFCVV